MIPIQQDQLVRSALRFANKIDKDCISVIGTGTGSSVVASGKSLAFDGTEFVISGSGGPGIGTYDLINGKAQIEQYNYMPDTLLVHPLQKAHIEKLPHFTSLMHYGEPILQEGLIAVPGKFGDILGLDAYCSINCPTGSAYVLSRGRTTNILGQYKGISLSLPCCEPHGDVCRNLKVEDDFKLQRRPITTGITKEQNISIQKRTFLEHPEIKDKISRTLLSKTKIIPKELFYNLYINQRKSLGFVAKKFGISRFQVTLRLKSYKIPLRSRLEQIHISGTPNKLNFDEKTLINKYTIEKKSVSAIARELKCSVVPIFRILKEQNIQLRTFAEESILHPSKKSGTKIELIMKQKFEQFIPSVKYQIPVGICIPDFIEPSLKIAIFCDGDYWHNLPVNKTRDRYVNEYLKRNNWTILRFKEKEIKENSEECLKKVHFAIDSLVPKKALEERDSVGVYITARYSPVVLRGEIIDYNNNDAKPFVPSQE